MSKYNKENPLRVFEAFAGYGSQHLAFDRIKKRKQKAEQDEKIFRATLMEGLDICEDLISKNEPLSDKWCLGVRYLAQFQHAFDEKYIGEGAVDELDVLRTYRKVKQGRDTV